MTETEKFIKILREHLANSGMAASIGEIPKFVYLKKEYVIVDLKQLSLSYTENFIDPNPEKYYKSFMRFCGKAMGFSYKQPQFGFIFSYNNRQVIKHINLNQYREDLSTFLVKKFDNFIIGVNGNNEITMQVKSYADSTKNLDIRLEVKVEQAVHNYNRYNPDYIVHAATYFRLTDYYGNQKYSFSVGF